MSTSSDGPRETELEQREQASGRQPGPSRLRARAARSLRRSRRRARSRRRRGSRAGPRRRLHGLEDVVVAGAAAEVALEPEADLLLRRVRVLLQQRDRRHHEAGRADSRTGAHGSRGTPAGRDAARRQRPGPRSSSPRRRRPGRRAPCTTSPTRRRAARCTHRTKSCRSRRSSPSGPGARAGSRRAACAARRPRPARCR